MVIVLNTKKDNDPTRTKSSGDIRYIFRNLTDVTLKNSLQYLDSIKPEILVLNGDIIDIWNFKVRYFPQSHTDVLRKY